jgi:hypothetical protein
MSFATTSMRGAALNCRLALNGIQNARRSFGAAAVRLDIAGVSLVAPRALFAAAAPLSPPDNRHATTGPRCVKPDLRRHSCSTREFTF